MSNVTPVPQPLEQAIQQASSTYGVPPDLEEGIWRIESKSTFPNPYVNSSGYGGLFGTTDAYGPTQEQANLSASILSNLLRSTGGNVGQALSDYSGGGYTSVPGETTFGTISVPQSAGPAVTQTGTPTAFTSSSSSQQASGAQQTANTLTGSIRELALRAGELLLGALLVYFGIRQFGAVLLQRAAPAVSVLPAMGVL